MDVWAGEAEAEARVVVEEQYELVGNREAVEDGL
jgi:hypothetical protein